MSATGMRPERLAEGRIWRRYEVSTGETIEVWAPFHYKTDFSEGTECSATDSTAVAGSPWQKVDTNGSASVAVAAAAADKVNGAWELILDITNAAELAYMFWGDVLGVPAATAASATRYTNMECRVKLTSAALTTLDAQIGLASAHNATADTVSVNAWFKLAGTLDLLCETDDDTTNTDDKDTGLDLVSGTWYILRIDMSDLSDVKFYVDGARVCAGTTFSMAAIPASQGLQPYFRIQKTVGVEVITLTIDYCRIWGLRLGE